MEQPELIPFLQWLELNWRPLLRNAGLLATLALVVGYLAMAFRHGPLQGGDVTFRFVRTAFRDLIALSPRRIFALARLAIQESVRRRVLVVFILFLLILSFAGWFLNPATNDPAALYLSVVLTATTYLVLLTALFLSAFSLPTDMKNKTIYTVVTKPVRSGEIVLGRILGFAAIGTVLLAVMGLFSYGFVVRVLNHSHEVEMDSLTAVPVRGTAPAADEHKPVSTGRTTNVHGHRHEVTVYGDGSASTDIKQGHWHDVTGDSESALVAGPPEGMLVARVPIKGELRFLDRQGKASQKGISVGREWNYRSYIEGGSAAAAIWTFHDITPERFPDGLPIETTIRVFRTYKGKIKEGILGSLQIKNPKTGVVSAIDTFRAKDLYIDQRTIPRTLKDPSGKNLDLFDDLTSDGEVEVWLQCLDASQYFGVARADLYLRAPDASFVMNFIKGYLGIWLQMILVTSFGVMFSTFLSGPVAMMATMASVVLGYYTDFVVQLADAARRPGAQGVLPGGGPVESFIRIIKQQNMTLDLEPGLTRTVVKNVDWVILEAMEGVSKLLPDYSQFDNVSQVAHGMDVFPDSVLIQSCRAVAFLITAFIVGYFFLRTREVAQ